VQEHKKGKNAQEQQSSASGALLGELRFSMNVPPALQGVGNALARCCLIILGALANIPIAHAQ
jgi:hypothetical protein